MIVLHGLFELKDGYGDTDFRDAFDAFANHLRNQSLLLEWRFMRQEAHEGYNRRPPEAPNYIALEFADKTQSEACWAYVENDEEPIRSLHRRMNRQITNASFFLCSDV